MDIFLNNPDKSFQTAVIIRTLYYGLPKENYSIYISKKQKLESLIKYSRIPVQAFKNIVKFQIPDFSKYKNIYVVDPDAETSIKDILKEGKNIDLLIANFNKNNNIEFLNNNLNDNNIENIHFIKGIGCPYIEYETVSILYLYLIRNLATVIPPIKNKINKNILYLARKILDGFSYFGNFPIISPRVLYFALKQLYKQNKYILDLDSVEVKNNIYPEHIEIHYNFSIYDTKLNKITEFKVIFKNNLLYLYLPYIFSRKEIEEITFYIDFQRKRIYLSENEYIDKQSLTPKYDLLRFL